MSTSRYGMLYMNTAAETSVLASSTVINQTYLNLMRAGGAKHFTLMR